METTTTIARARLANTASKTAIATAPAPGRATVNADGASSSRTTTGKTPAVTNTGWAITGTTSVPIARATSKDTAAPTATKAAAIGIATTTAGMTATGTPMTGAK